MPQQIDGHHGHGEVAAHVLRAAVLHAEILAEAQGLRLHPSLLQLNKGDAFAALCVAYGGGEVKAEHRQLVALVITVFMGTHIDLYHVFLQKGREDGAGDALVLHHVLEHYVINGVGYFHNLCVFVYRVQTYIKFLNYTTVLIKK